MMIAFLMTGIGAGTWLTGIVHQYYSLGNVYQFAIIYPLAILILTYLFKRQPNLERT
jgi:predicted MFS family arabinose efflux permease